MEFNICVNRNICEFDIIELSSYIFSEEGCLDLYLGEEESLNNEKSDEELWQFHCSYSIRFVAYAMSE